MRDYYTYNLTSDEDCCLMMMLEYFEDMGLPEDFNQRAFDSLSDKFYNNLKNSASWQTGTQVVVSCVQWTIMNT